MTMPPGHEASDLIVRDGIPESFLSCSVEELGGLLGGPSLFYLDGARKPPLFVTILQHGNEPTGFDAVQRLLRRYRTGMLPRAMWLFVSNVAAAEQGMRVLPGQRDHNRVWPGTEDSNCREAQLMRDVVAHVTREPLFASIDLHNNTGCNPHYACVNRLDAPFLRLATLFARTVVFFQQPTGVQSMAMAAFCPAVTLECGKAGEEAALDHATDYLEACLHLHHVPGKPVAPGDIHLLRTQAIVRVRPDVAFGFDGDANNVRFRSDLETFNFGCIPEGAILATTDGTGSLPVVATAGGTLDVTDTLFTLRGDKLVARQSLIPSMATQNVDVIRQDCLFYVMEEMQGVGADPAALP